MLLRHQLSIRFSSGQCLRIQTILMRIQIRIRPLMKKAEPDRPLKKTDPDPALN
jgi:hypothetical protein